MGRVTSKPDHQSSHEGDPISPQVPDFPKRSEERAKRDYRSTELTPEQCAYLDALAQKLAPTFLQLVRKHEGTFSED